MGEEHTMVKKRETNSVIHQKDDEDGKRGGRALLSPKQSMQEIV